MENALTAPTKRSTSVRLLCVIAVPALLLVSTPAARAQADAVAPPTEGDADVGAPSTDADADAAAPSTDADHVEATVGHADAVPSERRDAEFYRGRSREPTAEEVLLWIPRIVLFPIHLVTEYVLRIPVIALLAWAEQNHLFALFERIFNPTPDFSWSPTVSLEAGVFALPGLQARWRNMGVAGHELRIAGTFAGDDFWSLALRDRWTFDSVYLGARGGYTTRPDRAFYGLGPDSPNTRANFSETRTEAVGFFGVTHQNYVRIELSGAWSREAVGQGMSPSVETRADAPAAPGFGPFDLALVGLDVRLDTRRELEENGGLRLRAGATYGLDPGTGAYQFVTVDVDVEAAAEVSHPDRVLAARVHVGETAPLGGGTVPFLHLATLGWNNHQGFVLGRFRGEAAFLVEVRYRYPIHYFVDLQWTASVGNVFARDFSDFSAGALTGSFGIGLRTRRTGSDPIEATLAIGTTQFDSNLSIESVRLYLSTSEGL